MLENRGNLHQLSCLSCSSISHLPNKQQVTLNMKTWIIITRKTKVGDWKVSSSSIIMVDWSICERLVFVTNFGFSSKIIMSVILLLDLDILIFVIHVFLQNDQIVRGIYLYKKWTTLLFSEFDTFMFFLIDVLKLNFQMFSCMFSNLFYF